MRWLVLLLVLCGCQETTEPLDVPDYARHPTKVLLLTPNGPGALAENFPVGTASTNWECSELADMAWVPDGSGGWTSGGSGVALFDTFANQVGRDFYSVSFTPNAFAIAGVRITVRASRYPDLPVPSSHAEIEPGLRFVNTNQHFSTPQVLSGDFASYSFTWDTNPDTGLPWEWSDLTGIQIGLRQSTVSGLFSVADQVYGEVIYVPGHFFRDGEPTAGTAFGFFSDADNEIKNYLTGTFAYADLQSLSAFIQATVNTIRPGRYDENLVHEGPSNYPMIYIGSYLLDTVDHEPRTLMPRIETKVKIWSSRADPQEAKVECDAIAGACLSMLRQSDFDRDAFVWTGHYNNMPQDAGNHAVLTPARVDTAPDGSYTGRVKAELTLNWLHAEDI